MLVSPHVQSWVTVTAKYRGLVFIHLHMRLYNIHQVTCTNGVVTTEPDVLFRVFVPNFLGIPKRGFRNQTISTSIPHPRFFFPTKIRIADVFCIVLKIPRVKPPVNHRLRSIISALTHGLVSSRRQPPTFTSHTSPKLTATHYVRFPSVTTECWRPTWLNKFG